jgi:hypothetical protein
MKRNEAALGVQASLSNMAIFNRDTLLQHLCQQFQIDWWGNHSIAHWAHVRANGLMLALQGAGD